jgi:hypothetical protein
MIIGLQLRSIMLRNDVTSDGIKGAEIDSLGMKKALEKMGHKVFRFYTEQKSCLSMDLCITYTTTGKPRKEAKINVLVYQKFFQWDDQTNSFFDLSEDEVLSLVEFENKAFDLVVTPSNRICESLQKVLFFPLAIDHELYKPINLTDVPDLLIEKYLCNVMFMGKMETRGPNYYNVYSEYLFPYFRDYKLHLYGSNTWLNNENYSKYYKGPVPLEEAKYAFSLADIVVSLHSPALIFWDLITARLYQALACNSVVLSDNMPSITSEFSQYIISHSESFEFLDCIQPGHKSLDSQKDVASPPIFSNVKLKAIEGGNYVREYHNWDVRAVKLLETLSIFDL